MLTSFDDYRLAARRRLPHFLFEYFDGGSYGEATLRRNVEDLGRIALRQRVLRDVGSLDLSVNLFGERWTMPIALGPVGLAGLSARRGEVQAARAAERFGVPFCLSTVSACPVAEVRGAVTKPFWFQLYMIRDRAFMIDLMDRVAAAGTTTLVFTVDMPVPGSRYRDVRSGLAGSPGLVGSMRRIMQAAARPRWAWDVGVNGRPHALGNVAPVLGAKSGLEDFFAWMRGNFDATVTWDDVAWLRQHWAGRIVLKGLLDPVDAHEAVAAGVDGIVVSNHGGRQLDGVPSTARALPAIVEAVAGRIPVLVDGGVRSGLDVLRMMALGADAVLLGRAWAYGLAARGGAGVADILQLIEAELRVAMALTGITRIAGIDRDALVREEPNGALR